MVQAVSRSPAAEVERALAARALSGAPGGTASRRLAEGDNWSVHDVVCTSGPDDRPFEERHSRVGLAVVAAGSFRYRSAAGGELLTPGALLLGNAGATFECGHEHSAGDRCVAFQYERELFERLAAEAGAGRAERRFRVPRLPPLRALAPFAARATAGLRDARSASSWEELAFALAARAVAIAAGLPRGAARAPLDVEAKVARAVRAIEAEPDGDHGLSTLARAAGLSPYHFLRSFERVTGATPHQFVLRTRLRAAALALASIEFERRGEKVVEVAYASGFGDLSNFNRTFRSEFGSAPTAFARALAPQREAGGTTPLRRA